MLTIEQFEGLEVGDLIETSPLFAGLSQEPVILHTVEKSSDQLNFLVTYYGVTLGLWVCTRKNGELTWETK